MSNDRNIQANVLINQKTKAITVALDTSNETGNIVTLFEIPCRNEQHAWAIADAFNHPEHNSNDWREKELEPKKCGLCGNPLDQCYLACTEAY